MAKWLNAEYMNYLKINYIEVYNIWFGFKQQGLEYRNWMVLFSTKNNWSTIYRRC